MAVDWSLAAGTLRVVPAPERPDLLADPVERTIREYGAREGARIGVAEIEPEFADTATFCAQYGSPPERSANCVVVSGKRSGITRHAACMIPATTRADVNGVVRRRLDVRKASFTAMDDAVGLTGMEYGGITPFGLPADWPVLVDTAVAESSAVVVGSGLRRSKLVTPGEVLGELPAAEVVEGLGLT
ncbi:prolyl-tRNA editing enzyme YbaK/EbsC (Cys-tRNA(Pro) deacylase) [Saccharopolyspora lacisalsi]|uniref:Prolyl-tRNA editing enzyme YbaK/EbsC (Cys-tRNA(Pro) deacylase) n=1 Tax=Halosaccharopolyspora lacisalsi TaxID=1000566 RepID=A0A839E5P7_9PSEU|nr:YbaK/EbsC family protein [Halosaccharopolyspora lacisalsi]MBA8827185.1 prolyl-tRNA editing enzyme YbaK/EbsC (Cys-tRNA(Pro) deacylase) [Halosaccharopolyspora lacisalsi]